MTIKALWRARQLGSVTAVGGDNWMRCISLYRLTSWCRFDVGRHLCTLYQQHIAPPSTVSATANAADAVQRCAGSRLESITVSELH